MVSVEQISLLMKKLKANELTDTEANILYRHIDFQADNIKRMDKMITELINTGKTEGMYVVPGDGNTN